MIDIKYSRTADPDLPGVVRIRGCTDLVEVEIIIDSDDSAKNFQVLAAYTYTSMMGNGRVERRLRPGTHGMSDILGVKPFVKHIFTSKASPRMSMEEIIEAIENIVTKETKDIRQSTGWTTAQEMRDSQCEYNPAMYKVDEHTEDTPDI